MKIYRILPLIAVLLIAGYYSNAQGSYKAVADKIIATVSDKIVLQSDVKNAILDAKRQGQAVPEGAECMVLQQAIISKVMMLQAQKDSLPLSDEDVEASMDNKIRDYVNRMGKEAFEEMAGKTIYQFKDEMRDPTREQMLAEKMQQKIVENVKVSPSEVQAFFDRIPKDSLPYFESELEIGQIVIFPKASKEMEEYIVSEMNNYRRQIENKLSTFEQLAKRVSEDPGSKERGGSYEINRNEKTWDPVFLSTAFRLKDGEMSAPVKSKFGYHLIQMVKRAGDDALVRHILRSVPISEDELVIARAQLDTARSKVVSGAMNFNEAAGKYTNDENFGFTGPWVVSQQTGEAFVHIDELDRDLVNVLSKMKVGDISQPINYTDPQGKKGVRLIYLKSRTEPHVMNMRDDYSRIAEWTLGEKKQIAVEKWIKSKLNTFYIVLDEAYGNSCPVIKEFSTEIAAKSF